MVINQETVGCGVIENETSEQTGRVTAIFENSIHLTAENCVLTLGSEKIPNHPFTIRTNILPKSICIGDTFSITKRRLCIKRWSMSNLKQYPYIDGNMECINRVDACRDTATARQEKIGRSFYLNLRFMPIYTPSFTIKYIIPQENIIKELQECRREACLTTGIDGFFPILIGNDEDNQILEAVKPHIQRISLSIRDRDWLEFSKYSQKIVGVGIGLTPSGDDFLCGVFASLYFYNTIFNDRFTEDQLENLANSVGHKTSPFSATLIKAAARGWVQDLISNWLVSLFQGDSKHVKILTKKILEIGHSSGADILVGLITTLEAILSEGEE